MFPLLAASDLHLTDNPRDEYRWGLFPWLKEQVQSRGIHTVAILGDLTDAKDNHSAVLVNRVVSTLADLAKHARVLVMMGNHDYLKAGHPFFEFLSWIPNIHFIKRPELIDDCLFLPHSKTFAQDVLDLDLNAFGLVFMHQTVTGAIASNGMAMSGEIDSTALARGIVYSGDIHVPQRIGNVEYVGSPYHVHFGDRFAPRCLVFSDTETPPLTIRYKGSRRFTVKVASIDELQELDALGGDQLKVKLEIDTIDAERWMQFKGAVKSWADERGIELCGLELEVVDKRSLSVAAEERHATAARTSPEDAVRVFSEHERLPEPVQQAGRELVK